nr:DUF4365 domain-containing protein [Paraburkholderia sp. J7]
MAYLPSVTSSSDSEALGLRIAEYEISEKLGHIFRETAKRDIGIDAELEIVDRKNKTEARGTGRLIALQIKCGKSFFPKQKEIPLFFVGN